MKSADWEAVPCSEIKDNLIPAHCYLFCFGLLRWSRNGLNLSVVIRKRISHTGYEVFFLGFLFFLPGWEGNNNSYYV